MPRPIVLTALLLAGALARVVVLPLPGTRDVPDWKATSFVASMDFTGVYGRGGWPPDERRLDWANISATTEYPPINQMHMAAVGLLYRRIEPSFADSATLTTLIKMPGLFAEIALVVTLLTWGRRVIGARAATWAALAYWLNPGVWLTGAVLGYLDAQMAVPAVLALLAAFDRRPWLAGVLAAMAVFTKPQAVFVLPVLGLALLHSSGRIDWRRAAVSFVAALAVALVALSPFLVAGTWPSYWRAIQRMGSHDLVSGTATNLWWVATWAAGSIVRIGEIGILDALSRPATMVRISTAVATGIPNPRVVGTILTLIALVWAVWRGRHGVTRPAAFVLGAWSVLAYFMLSGQVHENHSYLALPLLAVAAAEVPRIRPLFWLITAAYVLNLYLFYGLGMTIPPVIDRSVTFVDASILLSVGYFALFAWLTRIVVTMTAPAPHTSNFA